MNRRLAPSLLAFVLALMLQAGSAAAAIWALVIGVDDYRNIPPLRGAVNDALDISDAVAGLPEATVTTLLDGEATRERIFATWRDYAARAQPGDTIIVTFAGHGSNEPAVYPETEEDGQDETLLLAGFAPQGQAAGERIRDDEIAELIALTPSVRVIFVADSCHSGTATRASIFDGEYRFYQNGRLVDDPLPPPPPPPVAKAETDFGGSGNSVFFGAVGDSEKAPEFPIGGQVRGALSYAFASGLRGAADRDGDGLILKGEFETHVRRFVKQATASRQRPRIAPAGLRDAVMFDLAAKAAPPESASPLALPFEELPPVAIRSDGAIDAGPLLSTIEGVQVVGAGQDDVSTLIVDLQRRQVRSARGDSLRRIFGSSTPGFRRQIQEIVDKMRVVQAVEAAALDSTLDVWFPLGDELYFENDAVRLNVDGRQHEHVTLFNLPSDGTVQWLYPINARFGRPGSFEDPDTLPPIEPLTLDVRVTPPFGSDHVVVIETPEPNDAVRRALNRHDGGTSLRALWTDLHHALRDTEHSVAVHAYFSKRDASQ